MEIMVFDTWVTTTQGQKMHFDVLVTADKADQAQIYAQQWLSSIGIHAADISQGTCAFCHTEQATPEIEADINAQGYFILQMAGCPSPV